MKKSPRRFALLLILAFFILTGPACDDQSDGELLPKGLGPVPDPPVTACEPELSVDEPNAAFSLASADCEAAWQNVTGQLALMQNGQRLWYDLVRWPDQEVTPYEGQTSWSISGHTWLPDLVLSIKRIDGAVQLQLLVSPFSTDVRVAGFRLSGLVELPGAPPTLRWLHHGYDSWTFTGVVELSRTHPAYPRVDGVEAPIGNNYDYWDDRNPVSWWVTGVRGPMFEPGIVLGAMRADLFKTYFVATPDPFSAGWRLSAITGTPGDSKPVSVGQTLQMDPLYFLITPDPVRGLLGYAQQTAKERPPLNWGGFEPKGWASWYDYFAEVTEQDMLENLERQRDRYLSEGFEVCQLDDGYMKRWGDWQDTNDRFPSGLAALSQTIHEAGLVPGIWLAPLMADRLSKVARRHPDWFLKDAQGGPLYVGDFFMGKKLTLDITHPDAAAWMAQEIRTMVEQGYRYLKLDFLFAGAVEAARFDPDVTSMEAYALACDAFREAAGPNVYLLASGQPFLPSAGRFHAARTSSDISGSPIDRPNLRMAHNIARYNAARFFAEGNWFDTDPDQLLIRPPLTDENAEIVLASNLLLGANLWLGDALVDLPAYRESLILSEFTRDLESLAGPTIPLDLFDAACPRVVNFPYLDFAIGASRTPKVFLRDGRLVLINWYGNTDTIDVTLSSLGYGQDDDMMAIDKETGEEVDPIDGLFRFTLSGIEMKMYTFVPR